VTAGAFPIEQVKLSSDDKWLYAVQAGANWRFDNDLLLRGALAYYGYDNITGIRNSFESAIFDYTAPLWLQKGNTLFDIRNDADPATNLFALAAEYQLVDLVLGLDVPVFSDYQLSLMADYVTNIGYDKDDVLVRTGLDVPARTDGYSIEIGFGSPKLDRLNAWRAAIRYRHLQRDAVLDAFTDSDFHLGGTDSQGYVLRGDYGLGRKVYLTLRYLSASEIDGPPLGIDVWQLDLNGQF
jgi:Putative porin